MANNNSKGSQKNNRRKNGLSGALLLLLIVLGVVILMSTTGLFNFNKPTEIKYKDFITMVTSNIPMAHEDLRSRYGERATSRMAEMMNYLTLTGRDRRQNY